LIILGSQVIKTRLLSAGSRLQFSSSHVKTAKEYATLASNSKLILRWQPRKRPGGYPYPQKALAALEF